jgi:hypothetical protein
MGFELQRAEFSLNRMLMPTVATIRRKKFCLNGNLQKLVTFPRILLDNVINGLTWN